MLLTYGNAEVSVHFVYSACEGRKITTCYLHTGRCEEKGCSRKERPLFGEARCNPRDQFSRSLGREIALGRAFKRAGYTTEMRDALWARYAVALVPAAKAKQ
jgi:hypothetical protein